MSELGLTEVTILLDNNSLLLLLTLLQDRDSSAMPGQPDSTNTTGRLGLVINPVEVINNTRLLGTIVQDNLSWDMNTRDIVKKANARMEILRRVSLSI